jgi:mono/diheme cytochrome c family protein
MTIAPFVTPIPIRLAAFSVSIAVCCCVGCDSPIASFEPNRLLKARMESDLQSDLTSIELQSQSALKSLFGTPDEPRWPDIVASDPRCKTLIDPVMLDRAAGPVRRDSKLIERGLYRKHCAQCHGITGDGLGPSSALLNPYPRDFRRGSFKFKSTTQGAKPTLEDLVRTIEHGLAGTSMPAMVNLIRGAHYDNDIPILAAYVRYLAIRGEVERRLMMELVPNIDIEASESLFDESLKKTDPSKFADQQAKIDAIVLKVANAWIEPQRAEIVVSEGLRLEENAWDDMAHRDAFLKSASRGHELFLGETAACAQCHGKAGDGKGKLVDFDEWTKDWTIRAGIDPKDSKQWKPLKELGLLKPIPSAARNLRLGVFRGGSSPDAIYRTIAHGIEGTPMPAAARQPSVKNGLTESQLWDLVNYCLVLGNAELRKSLEATDEKR